MKRVNNTSSCSWIYSINYLATKIMSQQPLSFVVPVRCLPQYDKASPRSPEQTFSQPHLTSWCHVSYHSSVDLPSWHWHHLSILLRSPLLLHYHSKQLLSTEATCPVAQDHHTTTLREPWVSSMEELEVMLSLQHLWWSTTILSYRVRSRHAPHAPAVNEYISNKFSHL